MRFGGVSNPVMVANQEAPNPKFQVIENLCANEQSGMFESGRGLPQSKTLREFGSLYGEP